MTNRMQVIHDPLISTSGKVYSAGALVRLLAELRKKYVDDHVHLYGRMKCRKEGEHGCRQQNGNNGKLRG